MFVIEIKRTVANASLLNHVSASSVPRTITIIFLCFITNQLKVMFIVYICSTKLMQRTFV